MKIRRALLRMGAVLVLALVVAGPASAQSADQGISFGPPVVFSTGGMQSVSLLVTNTTQNVKSFTVQATWVTGGAIAATATGAVNDLAPGQTRAAALLSMDQIPPNADSVQVTVGTMVADAPSTRGANTAAQITFGPPRVSSLGSISTVEVQVTNTDAAPHSLTVQADFLAGDQLIGVATGAVNGLGPGQTKTASLLMAGTAQGADQTLLAPDTIVQ